MILLSGDAVMIAFPDGTQRAFDVEELQAGIVNACLAAGVREVWLAEDIALAIEFALTGGGNGASRIYAESDVNEVVLKVLGESGYPEVAEHYSRQNPGPKKAIPATENSTIKSLLQKHLGLSDEILQRTTAAVSAALEKLAVQKSSPVLILELAKHYRDRDFPMQEPSLALPAREGREDSPWLISPERVREMIPEAALKMIENNVLRLSGVSQLFPSLKIDLDLLNFAAKEDLHPPVTELAIFPKLSHLATVFNEMIQVLGDLVRESRKKTQLEFTTPIYLRVTNLEKFSSEFLQAQWPETSSICHEMIGYLESSLKQNVYKVSLK